MSLHVFGIRHHGPGSARSLLRALEEIGPDVLLVEGPPDADDVIPLAVHAGMTPPVALLVYDEKRPGRAAFYPFASFSPEWQAIRFALERGVPVRFMDLPQSHRLALEDAAEKAAADVEESEGTEDDTEEGDDTVTDEASADEESGFAFRADPLDALAQAAGHGGGEAWWEHIVEHRRDGADVFAAVLEAMTAVREELAPDTLGKAPETPQSARGLAEARREAWMRKTIRGAKREGFERIAVVCGAWHAPALAAPPQVKWDTALLKSLPKTRTAATWVPWTHSRLAASSGYGAGVRSPAWYELLWTAEGDVGTRWTSRVARLLRSEGLDASPAQVVDAVRLSESLAALRGLSIAGLDELEQAVLCVLLHGERTPLDLIRRRLIIGEELGAVPEDAPTVPLQRDLEATRKRLRLKFAAIEKTYDLDLRREIDRERSHLWHRLALLDVRWAAPAEGRGGAGTFHEYWEVQWAPECVVELVDAARWGNTIPEAATARVAARAEEASLPGLCKLVDHVLLADLPDAAADVVTRIQDAAAVADDVGALLDAVPPLVHVLRYGSVRELDTSSLAHVVTGLVQRMGPGLVAACSSLDDEAAADMRKRLTGVHAALTRLADESLSASWLASLVRLSTRADLHGLLAGAVTRMLLDAGRVDAEEAGRRLQLHLSRPADAGSGAAWIDGFLRDSGSLLVHDETLRGIVDAWIVGLSGDAFTEVLPLLRRTFSTFESAERRKIGERLREGRTAAAPEAEDLDSARADLVLPVVARMLGISGGAS